MAKKMVSFYATKKNYEDLKVLSKRDGMSMGEHIRRAINLYFRKMSELDSYLSSRRPRP